MQTFIFILEIIGTIAFAISGAMTALKKNMDIFGGAILGLTTAVGGGALRDIILGITPPTMFTKPVYAAVAVCVSIIIFIPAIRRLFMHNHLLHDLMLYGLAIAGLVLLLVFCKRARFEPALLPLQRGKHVAACLGTPGAILFLIAGVAMLVLSSFL